MAKFMLSLREENFQLLTNEAEERGITVQELIRAVIIPDWVRQTGPANNGRGTLATVEDNGRQLLQPIGVRKYGSYSH